MTKLVSKQTRREVTQALRERYARASKAEKARILDEFVALSGFHRKHAIRVLRSKSLEPWAGRRGGRRVYEEAVREALLVVREAADRICGKRLKQVLPQCVEAMEQHGHLQLDPGVRERLLSASAATLDRLLSPIRKTAKSRKPRPSRTEFSKRVRVRTFADWHNPGPGFLEMDFVAHGGGSMAGVFVHSLVVTDVCTGWTEAIPLLARDQSLVVEALERLRGQVPVPIVGVDSDNDSAFINETLVSYCESRKIEFTRSRAYRKNDQAWIEQKNGAVIRRFVGHGRLAGAVAGQTLAHLYHALRLYVNYFQPSFKLKSKTRKGSRVKKTYFDPATPCERLLGDERGRSCEGGAASRAGPVGSGGIAASHPGARNPRSSRSAARSQGATIARTGWRSFWRSFLVCGSPGRRGRRIARRRGSLATGEPGSVGGGQK